MTDRRSLLSPAELAGLRLDVAVTRAWSDLSRARAQALLEAGHVTLDGAVAKASHRVQAGATLAVEIPPPAPSGLVAQDLPLAVLHEDAAILVLDKAAGMVVHPARGSPHSTVVNALLHRMGEGAPGGDRLGLVHRLDKETSGCLVVARTAEALAALQGQFKGRTVEKTYLALCHGALPERGRLDTFYGRHPRDRKRFTGRVRGGRRAITEWVVRERFGDAATLVEVTLHTGRTHQIRVHLSEAGHPLLADESYGGRRREARLGADDAVRRAAEAVGRQALHAWRLAFDHPVSGRRVAFEAPLPKDLEAALALLRGPLTLTLSPGGGEGKNSSVSRRRRSPARGRS
ncbi:MAG TPA: RluA family pseudouridine synthase [Anaeromyxobacteraceae bacterium]|nr:RluA family pseudouridine synthase [Anaeromyxobacteraceae bacterium]